MSKYTDKDFYCLVSFDVQHGGPINIPAKSEEEARELLSKQYSHQKNFVIHKVVDSSLIEPPASEAMFEETKPETTH